MEKYADQDARSVDLNPLRTIKFRPLPRSRKTERVRPLKTIHVIPPPRPGEVLERL